MGMRRIVAERIVTEEGVGYTVRPCFPPPERYRNSMLPHGLWPPHYGRSYGDQGWDSPAHMFRKGTYQTGYALLLISALLALAFVTVARLIFPLPARLEEGRTAPAKGLTRTY